jgi:DNA-binding Xre family transcriptional regulator
MEKKPTYLTGDDAIRIATIRNNLKYIMLNKKTSFGKLGRKLGIDGNTLRYRVCTATPSDELIHQIADALECTMDDLLDEDGNPWNFGKSAEEIAELNAMRRKEREKKRMLEQEATE